MRVVREDHSTLDFVYPGVRQDHTGLAYREGRLLDGEAVKVEATDTRKFALSQGTFERDTLYVIVEDKTGRQYRTDDTGERPSKPALPERFYTRRPSGIGYNVG